jgi:hypothetical protein
MSAIGNLTGHLLFGTELAACHIEHGRAEVTTGNKSCSRRLKIPVPAAISSTRRLAAAADRHPASRLDELLRWNWKGRSARLVA